MKYRSEIDGLRAVAVLSVILYHAGFTVLSGGFVGVDVFFVISGYLITTLLISDLKHENFSIFQFYERRMRRILPALFFVLTASLPFAYFYILPNDFKIFGQSLITTVLGLSNLYFMTKVNYFAQSADLQPLLHTWSLAVEEQYYLIFPSLLAFTWRKSRNYALLAITILVTVSFLFSHWAAFENPSRNFFFTLSRFWEIGLGSICAFFNFRPHAKLNNFLGLFGFLLILISIFWYDSSIPFPSSWTLIPVFGSALVVLFATDTTFVGRLLSTTPLVNIGLISYSAYLWHQPIFVFARVKSIKEPGIAMMTILTVVSFALAWLTWRFVERPFRKGAGSFLIKSRSLFFASSAIGSALILFGVSAQLLNGFEFRFSNEILAKVNMRSGDSSGCLGKYTSESIIKGAECKLGEKSQKTTIAILGDSHASILTDALNEQLISSGFSAAFFTRPWCPPLRNFATNANGKNKCLHEVNAALDQVLNKSEIKTVVLVAEWANYVEGSRWNDRVQASYVYNQDGILNGSVGKIDLNPLNFKLALDKTLDELKGADKNIIIVLPIPEQVFDVPSAAVKAYNAGLNLNEFAINADDYDARVGRARQILLKSIGNSSNIRIIDPRSIFCSKKTCYVVNDIGEPLYADDNHLNYLGSLPLATGIMQIITPKISPN